MVTPISGECILAHFGLDLGAASLPNALSSTAQKPKVLSKCPRICTPLQKVTQRNPSFQQASCHMVICPGFMLRGKLSRISHTKRVCQTNPPAHGRGAIKLRGISPVLYPGSSAFSFCMLAFSYPFILACLMLHFVSCISYCKLCGC